MKINIKNKRKKRLLRNPAVKMDTQAHLLRELTFIEEKYGYRWAHEAKFFLLDAKGFELILLRGRSEMRDLIAKVENRGKQHPALNLGNRMLKETSGWRRFT